MKHYELIIKVARLNGGFRFPVMERAWKLGIRGYVSRAGEGRFRIEAEGEEEPLDEFIDFCKKGPVGTPVSSFKISEGSIVNYESFDIK